MPGESWDDLVAGGLPDAEIVDNVRARADLPQAPPGPTDEQIAAGVHGFASQFHYWYYRVLERALPKFDKQIIDRVNPMIRGMQLEGLSAEEAAIRLVGDYAHRNYVTAGGWALEQLAIDSSPRLRKSASTGVDAEWFESENPPVVHLYMIKSGSVTRNSDILAALKTHGREAHTRLRQTNRRAVVHVHYVVLTSQRTSSFADSVNRPSSAEFWAQALDLEDDEGIAVDLVLAMAQEAGALLKSLVKVHSFEALTMAVRAYIATSDDPNEVDWEFMARRNMIADPVITRENKARRRRAVQAVKDAGHTWPVIERITKAEQAEADAALAAELAGLTPEEQLGILEMLPDVDHLP